MKLDPNHLSTPSKSSDESVVKGVRSCLVTVQIFEAKEMARMRTIEEIHKNLDAPAKHQTHVIADLCSHHARIARTFIRMFRIKTRQDQTCPASKRFYYATLS